MAKDLLKEHKISRRAFLKTSALVGGSALVASQLELAFQQAAEVEAAGLPAYELNKPENILYTVCQQCNTQCGIKAKILNGTVVKIDGNPLSPFNLTPHLPYKTSPFETARVEGVLCPKGQAGIQTQYDPYRLRKVLKRAGKRGENKWETIPFEQAIDEVVNGGKLFAKVPGEENRIVPGLRDVWALKDAKVAKDMAADVKAILAEKDAEKKKAAVATFKEKYKDNLDELIDPDHPDFGPKNNQFVFAWGRLKGGRGELIRRFTGDALGSVNAHGHTTVCQGSLYFTGKAMSEQFTDGKWTGGKKFYWQADTGNSEFIIFVGASLFEGNYGPPLRVPKIVKGLAEGRLKYVVVDPRFSKLASKAWKWLPSQAGSEGAMALGLIRWVIENKRYDARYLANANKAAATAAKEPTWCNATWLIKIKDGKPGDFLRASEAGLPGKEKRKDAAGKEYDFDPFVVLKDGKPVAFDPYDTENPVTGDLLVDSKVGDVQVKSGLQILWESASSKSLEESARICDVKAEDLVELAKEFTSHGKRAAADVHRGVSQHTNGFYNVFAWFSLNLLIGNYDWKGGMAQLSTYDPVGKTDDPFPLANLTPKKAAPFGLSIIRHDAKFEESTLFDGKYPARRNWYPLASDIYQEIVPSIGDAYPYPVKILFLYMGSPVYALPAGHTNIEILADPNKLPLFVASDIVIGETTMYADYIFPDLSYLERWEFAGSHPSVVWKIQPVRQPVVAPLTETVKVYGQEMPLSLEAMLLGLAEKLGLPNFGQHGLAEGQDFTHQDHLYLRMVANVAAGNKAGAEVPDADDAEVKLFLDSRKHLPRTVFDPDRWKAIVGDEWWKKVIYVLNRGGRFDDFEKGYDGDQLKNKYGALINLYQEKTAKVKDSGTGKALPGYATYIPAPLDFAGKEVKDEGYNLRLITYRDILMTKTRTIANPWLTELLPENGILINSKDAEALGLKPGDKAKILSASNPEGVWDLKNGQKVSMVGTVLISEGIRPGVVGFSLGHGHWAYGASDVTIDGEAVKADPARARGIHANAAMRVDPVLKNTCLIDKVGGSAVFYDTMVKVVKV